MDGKETDAGSYKHFLNCINMGHIQIFSICRPLQFFYSSCLSQSTNDLNQNCFEGGVHNVPINIFKLDMANVLFLGCSTNRSAK